MKKLEEYVRSIPDFPEPGIIFRDITTILQDPDGLHLAIQSMQDKLKDTEFDVVVGTESRGLFLVYRLHITCTRHLYRFERKASCHVRRSAWNMTWNTEVL